MLTSFIDIVHRNKHNKKLQLPGALNIQGTPGYKYEKKNKKNNVNR